MIEEEGEYILPVRFDDTPVPGLPSDIIYECARKYTPAELATMIASKLGVHPFAGKASQVPPPRMTSATGEVAFDYGSYNGRYVIGSGVLGFETRWSSASDTSVHVYNDPPSINGVALASGSTSDLTGREGRVAGLHFSVSDTIRRPNRRTAQHGGLLRRPSSARNQERQAWRRQR